MLSSRIGRHAIRQLNPSTCSLLQRVQSVNCVSADSQTSNSTSLAIRTRPLSNSQMVNLRGFATKGVVSKPKAHTGRNTVRKAKAASATGAKTSAKRAPAKKAPAKKAKVKDRKTNKKSAKKTVSKAKARPKKAITPEQKQKARLRELKAKALAPPHSLPNNAWKVLDVEMIKNAKSLAIGAKEASVKYKNLLPEEREVSGSSFSNGSNLADDSVLAI